MSAPHDASRVALVTGAASGIGQATARAFVSAGYLVCGFDINPAVVAELPAPHCGVCVDVGDSDALEAAIGKLRARGELAHVISVVGRLLPAELGLWGDERSLVDAVAVFRASVELNLICQFALLRATRDWLLSSPGDRSITLVSSVNALAPFGGAAYSASKAGLHGLVRHFSDTLGAHCIRINAVAPGTTVTPLTMAEAVACDDSARFERAAASTSLGRVAQPEDIADAILGLTAMHHVTGQILVVDGGQTRSKRR